MEIINQLEIQGIVADPVAEDNRYYYIRRKDDLRYFTIEHDNRTIDYPIDSSLIIECESPCLKKRISKIYWSGENMVAHLQKIGIDAEVYAEDDHYLYFQRSEEEGSGLFAMDKVPDEGGSRILAFLLKEMYPDMKPTDHMWKPLRTNYRTYHPDMRPQELMSIITNQLGINCSFKMEDEWGIYLLSYGKSKSKERGVHRVRENKLIGFKKPIVLPLIYTSTSTQKREVMSCDPILQVTDRDVIEQIKSNLPTYLDANVRITGYDSAEIIVKDTIVVKDEFGDHIMYLSKIKWTSKSIYIGERINFEIPLGVLHDKLERADIYSEINDIVIKRLENLKELTIGPSIKDVGFITNFKQLESLYLTSEKIIDFPDLSHLKKLWRVEYRGKKELEYLYEINSITMLKLGKTEITSYNFLKLSNLKYISCKHITVEMKDIKDRDIIIGHWENKEYEYFHTKTKRYLERDDICYEEGNRCREAKYHVHP